MRFLLMIVCAVALVIGSMVPAGAQGTGDGFGIFGQAGFGFANNLRLADWLNWQNDWIGKPAVGANMKEETDTTNMFYGGLELEPRYFSGNLVYGLSIGFQNTNKGERKVTGNNGTFQATADLNFFLMKASMYYRVVVSDTSFVLLGGGLGYYRANLELETKFNNTIVNEGSGSAWTIGWHMGIEYNKRLGPVYLSLGLLSRFAEVWNMEFDNQNGNEMIDSSVNLTGFYLYAGVGYMI